MPDSDKKPCGLPLATFSACTTRKEKVGQWDNNLLDKYMEMKVNFYEAPPDVFAIGSRCDTGHYKPVQQLGSDPACQSQI